MKTRGALGWFKTSFNKQLEDAVVHTPFSVDMLTAIAYQESGEVWPVLVDKRLSIPKILELCVGDTIDKAGRNFPEDRRKIRAHRGRSSGDR